ncbi:hypothetical protein J437_LFUL003056 [Ladona fulva]|uniref:Insulin-like domain-containing protein n=1 Tax=Ladona fulva TaxID=123851 RepID=A0A8K0NY45_LADFU|nr:hypothetical protein J437_LFUL003056 [Ladona fulva]
MCELCKRERRIMRTMFTRLVATFTLCSCLFLVANCQQDMMSMGEKRSSSKFCGTNLSNALQLVCNGIYNPMFKKSPPGEFADPDNESPYWLPPLEEIQFPFRPKASAKVLIGSFRRQKRGVYDECCRKSCTVNELTSYCGRR